MAKLCTLAYPHACGEAPGRCPVLHAASPLLYTVFTVFRGMPVALLISGRDLTLGPYPIMNSGFPKTYQYKNGTVHKTQKAVERYGKGIVDRIGTCADVKAEDPELFDELVCEIFVF